MNFFRSLGLFTAVLLLVAASCTSSQSGQKVSKLNQWMSDNGKLKVLCTTAMIADIVKDVGQDEIDCLTLIQGESDPHSYQLVKGDDEKFTRADIIFYNGLGLEHGPSLAERLRGNWKAHSIGDFLLQERSKDILWIDTSPDPHVWMDVSLWQATVPFIQEKLSAAIPDKAAFFQNRGVELTQKLQKLHEQISLNLLQLPETRRYLVSSHEAFNYFVRAYLAQNDERSNNSWKVRSMAPEGLAPDSQLSTADIGRLVDHIIKYKVSALFSESNVSRDALKKLADVCVKRGHEVHIVKDPLFADAMGPEGSQAASYAGMISYDAEVIAKGLAN